MKKCEITGALPEPMGDMPAVVWKEGLYVFGGGTADEVRQDIYRIDVAGRHVEKVGKMPFRSRGHSAVLVEDRVYLLGGFDEGTLSHAYCYDLATGRPEKLPDMPQDNAWFSATSKDRKLYVVGGFSIPSGYWKDMVVYDMDKGSWEKYEDSFPEDIFPQRLLGSNSCLTIGDNIISFGGADSFDRNSMWANPLDVVAAFNPGTAQWQTTKLDIAPREGLTSVSKGRYVYLVGGASLGELHRYPYIDQLDISAGKTERYAEMTLGRTGAACGIIGDYLLIAGGVVGAVNEMTDRIERIRIEG